MHRVGVFVSLLWSFTVISRTRRRGAHPQDTALTIATSREGNRGGCSCKTAAAPRAPPSGFRHTPLCERAGFFCFRQGKRPLPRQPFVRRTPSACVGRGGGGWGRGGGAGYPARVLVQELFEVVPVQHHPLHSPVVTRVFSDSCTPPNHPYWQSRLQNPPDRPSEKSPTCTAARGGGAIRIKRGRSHRKVGGAPRTTTPAQYKQLKTLPVHRGKPSSRRRNTPNEHPPSCSFIERKTPRRTQLSCHPRVDEAASAEQRWKRRACVKK